MCVCIVYCISPRCVQILRVNNNVISNKRKKNFTAHYFHLKFHNTSFRPGKLSKKKSA